MKIKPIIYTVLILALALPAMAATKFTMPTFSSAWGGLDSEIAIKIMWIIGLSFVILVVAAILGSMFGGAKAALATVTGNVSQRTEGVSAVLITIGVVFIVTVVIGLLLWVAG